MIIRCNYGLYGIVCGEPIEFGELFCREHLKEKCSSCNKQATHICTYCGQFVCGAPLCDDCTDYTDRSKPSGAWGFLNHTHVKK